MIDRLLRMYSNEPLFRCNFEFHSTFKLIYLSFSSILIFIEKFIYRFNVLLKYILNTSQIEYKVWLK